MEADVPQDVKDRIVTENIREDGSVSGSVVWTVYCPCDALFLADGYLRVVIDGKEGYNIETRIPLDALRDFIGPERGER